jgi:hypothetical protein
MALEVQVALWVVVAVVVTAFLVSVAIGLVLGVLGLDEVDDGSAPLPAAHSVAKDASVRDAESAKLTEDWPGPLPLPAPLSAARQLSGRGTARGGRR